MHNATDDPLKLVTVGVLAVQPLAQVHVLSHLKPGLFEGHAYKKKHEITHCSLTEPDLRKVEIDAIKVIRFEAMKATELKTVLKQSQIKSLQDLGFASSHSSSFSSFTPSSPMTTNQVSRSCWELFHSLLFEPPSKKQKLCCISDALALTSRFLSD